MRLTDEERATYQWQMWVSDLGESGQAKLKSASVFVSRTGGLGSVVAYELAAAGIGRLVIAHGGRVKPSDLNRQLLMTHDWIGRPRIESVTRRLRALNPRLDIVACGENASDDNVAELIDQCDIAVDAAPLFEERYAINRAAIEASKPIVTSGMYELEAQLMTVDPRRTACLQCLWPVKPPTWKREFPVFGAVAGTVGCLAAMEVIKLITGIGAPLHDRMLRIDLRTMQFRTLNVRRSPACVTCGRKQPWETIPCN
ncbi:MAG: HesA/MoeB/ThiF family protein [Planctomycetota bacterium]